MRYVIVRTEVLLPIIARMLRTVACLAALCPTLAAAQTREARLLTLTGVRRIVAAAESEAIRQGWNVTIAVVDAAGELIYLQRADDASANTADLATGKARTAARFRRPTRSLDSTIAAGRTHLLVIDGLVPFEGGLPIEVDGRVIGAIGVSGATSQQDGIVAKAGVAAVVR